MKYRYFVSYAHRRGFGMIDVGRNSKIENMDDIASMKKSIEENDESLGSIVVISWQPFE